MATQFASSAGSLAEGAERLDRLIRGVKDRQFSEVGNAPAPKSVSTAFAVSPEEAWSKKFMTAGIGPMAFKPVQMPVVPIAAPMTTLKPMAKAPEPKMLEPVLEARAHAPAKPAAAPAADRPMESPGAVRPGHIGAVLAKPARRKTWFGRLVKDG